MTKNNRAFTLIELLVVVLIIGILAAVALPQYQQVVEKSRATHAIAWIADMEKAIDAYLLENGLPQQVGDLVEFADPDTDEFVELDMNPPSGCLSGSFSRPGYCVKEFFTVSATCTNNSPQPNRCDIGVFRATPSEYTNGWILGDVLHYALFSSKNTNTDKWTHTCIYEDTLGEKICNSLNHWKN